MRYKRKVLSISLFLFVLGTLVGYLFIIIQNPIHESSFYRWVYRIGMLFFLALIIANYFEKSIAMCSHLAIIVSMYLLYAMLFLTDKNDFGHMFFLFEIPILFSMLFLEIKDMIGYMVLGAINFLIFPVVNPEYELTEIIGPMVNIAFIGIMFVLLIVHLKTLEVTKMKYMKSTANEEKSVLEQVLYQQKMSEFERLSGKITHDLNNFFAVVQGYADLILIGSDHNDVHLYAHDIQSSISRIRPVVDQLQVFSENAIVNLSPVLLNDLLADSKEDLVQLVGTSIVLDMELCKENSTIMADKRQIYHIIVNLVRNSKEAIIGSGNIKISTSIITNRDYRLANFFGKDYVVLSVRDDGSGMDIEVLENLFTPFFSTKPTGKGSGLGLYAIRNLVEFYNGYINVRSNAEEGTVFDIYFPTVENEAPEKAGIEKKQATILLIEDNDDIRYSLGQLLNAYGFQVLDAPCAEKGLEILNDNVIDLIIADIMMDSMDGIEFAREASRLYDLPIILISGYSNNELLPYLDKDLINTKFALLQKPFNHTDLIETIRSLLV